MQVSEAYRRTLQQPVNVLSAIYCLLSFLTERMPAFSRNGAFSGKTVQNF